MHTNGVITEIPEMVWEKAAEYCEKMEKAGSFFPLEAKDAKAYAAEDLVKAIGRPKPANASVETYLTSVFRYALYRFHNREVLSARELYRATERKLLGTGASESTEETWYEETIERGHDVLTLPMTMHDLGEGVAGKPSARTRRNEARMRLCEICAHLPYSVKRVFAAYIRADGDFDVMAASLHIARSAAYSRFNRAIALARKAV